MAYDLNRHDFFKGAALFAASFGIGWADAATAADGAPRVRRRDLSRYVIVLPDQPAPPEQEAADILSRHLAEVLGKPLPVVREADRGAGPAFLIGATAAAARSYPAAARLAREAFAIVPVGNDLVLVGGSAPGVRHAAYGLLEFWGFRRFASDALLRPKPNALGLPDRTLSASPRIDYRTMLYADSAKGEYPAWQRLSPTDRWGMFVHTFNDLIPPETYGTSDPDFFSLIDGRRLPGTQLCLSNDRMRATLIANLATRMKAKPTATYWSVSQNDNDQHCRCAGCAALDARYGGVPSGSILHFVNQVARAFPQQTISTLAYWYSRAAPQHIRAQPNVNIMLCNIESRRHAPVFETDPGFSRDLAAWGAIADSILIWDYEIQFTNLVSPFPNLHTIKPNIDFFVKNRVDALFMQANRDSGGEFAELRAYLIARLMWDPQADDGAIMDEFLAGYYGPAAPHIRDYIDTMRRRLAATGFALDIFGSPEGAKDAYLTAADLAAYQAMFDRAEAAVAADPVLRRRVIQARLPIMYAEIQIGRNEPVGSPRGLYVRRPDGTAAVRPERHALVERFAEQCAAGGVTRLRERSTSPADYLASYRRVFTNLAGMANAVSLGKPVAQADGGRLAPEALRRLTDGLFGSWESWSAPDPNWVAATGQHMDVTLDLGAVTDVRAIEATFLNAQAQPDYNTLVLPEYVTFSLSADGRTFAPLARLANPHDRDPRANPAISSVPIHRFGHENAAPTRARYVRVHAHSMLTMPRWHIMAGKPATISTDQIVVR